VTLRHLTEFGFSFRHGGAHTARTMMLEELKELLDYVDNGEMTRQEYLKAIVEDNCLGKRSVSSRKLTGNYLTSLYGLDSSIVIFRSLHYFWRKDEPGHPLIALLCAYARDSVLRISAPFILNFNEGEAVHREQLEDIIENNEPGRFGKSTLNSTAKNINSSWTQSGHLKGFRSKYRTIARVTPGAVAYALLLAYISGGRGVLLFESEYVKLLDCPVTQAIDMANQAARQGWMVFKHIGDVMEVAFPNLIKPQELEQIREQDKESY
jgi:hypothetical protein